MLVSAQIINPESIQNSIFNQLAFFPQEKIHVHTDRTMYVPGERIWFKAYVVDALSHQAPTYSQYAYIELINSSDSLVQRVMVSRDEYNMFHGNIFLSEKIQEGDYTLRAYTRYMENLGDDYFYKKPILISNLKASVKRQGRQPRANYDVSFFPEGGNLPEGIISRVAFKALNQQGASEFITGEIVDDKGNRIAEVSTVYAGMGSFVFLSESGREYYLVSKSSSGQEKRFKLPAAKKTCTIGTSSQNNRHYIQVKKSPDLQEKPLYLLVHCGGVVFYFASWNPQNEFISFSNEQLPSGVIQVLLFDEHMNPISERLIFNKNEDQVKLALSLDKPFYQKRERVISEISITDMEGNLLEGNVSIAVTDNKDIFIDSLNTITSSLLLSSELRGYIESPAYYLQNNSTAEFALDHLMMTHGWRRYEVSEAMKGNYSYPKIGYEVSKELSGSVKGGLLNKPVVNSEVFLMSNIRIFEQTLTDSAGLFRFHLHFPDTAQFMVRAKNQKGKDGVGLVLNQEKFPSVKHAPKSLQLLPALTNKEAQPPDAVSDFIKKAEQRAQYDEDMWAINMEEIVITENRIAKRDEIRLQYPHNALSTNTIYREQFEKTPTHLAWQQLYRVPGIYIYTGDGGVEIYMRGTGPDAYVGPPLILINGMVSTILDFDMLNVQEIESIDIFKGKNAFTAFGFRGQNGAISITLKDGYSNNYNDHHSVPNYASIAPLGYQAPVEFYAPKYDTPAAKNLSTPDYRTTIFWKPDLLISDDGKASVEFYTSDFPTTYSIVIEGITDDGKIIRHIETIEIR